MEEITLACTWYMVCRALKTQGLKPIKSLETRGQWFYRSAATRAMQNRLRYDLNYTGCTIRPEEF